jgi:hypothetical protein
VADVSALLSSVNAFAGELSTQLQQDAALLRSGSSFSLLLLLLLATAFTYAW